MPRLEAENAFYSPIYGRQRLGAHHIVIIGAIGERIYRTSTYAEAEQEYEDEWNRQEEENQEY